MTAWLTPDEVGRLTDTAPRSYAAQANKGKSPWRKGPMLHTANALRLTQSFNAAKDRADDSPSPRVGRSLTG